MDQTTLAEKESPIHGEPTVLRGDVCVDITVDGKEFYKMRWMDDGSDESHLPLGETGREFAPVHAEYPLLREIVDKLDSRVKVRGY